VKLKRPQLKGRDVVATPPNTPYKFKPEVNIPDRFKAGVNNPYKLKPGVNTPFEFKPESLLR
jgi:hypothetical protein